MAEEKETKNAKPVKLDKNGKEKVKLGERIKKFLRDYKSEMKKIVWPTRQQVIQNTGVVIFAIMFIAVIVGILDLAFGTGVISILGSIRDLIKSA
ncbi:MAG: preprotein translocase subunit SecE [Oscillospiraceae bacterium]|jgi:preprotein translocase subunit SecE|nr:preprotein translocase subunit SecE [Oscillospiraceae bacterium]